MSRWRTGTAVLRSTGYTSSRSGGERSAVALLQESLHSHISDGPSAHPEATVKQLLCHYRQGWHSHFRQQRSLFGAADACAKKYSERKLIKFSQKQLYDVVANVEEYRQFVPWCQRSVITTRNSPTELYAELEVGFKMFVERYTSQVILHEPRQVISRVSDSTLFDHLDTTWEFQPGPTPSTCWLNFHTDFAFRSPLYAQVASVFFDEVVKRMIGAFEGRCMHLYGKAGTSQAAPAPKGRKYQVA